MFPEEIYFERTASAINALSRKSSIWRSSQKRVRLEDGRTFSTRDII